MSKFNYEISKIQDSLPAFHSSLPDMPDDTVGSELSSFFQGAVQRLCGTLDLEASLGEFFTYLRGYVPVTSLVLGRSHFNTQATDIVAMCLAGPDAGNARADKAGSPRLPSTGPSPGPSTASLSTPLAAPPTGGIVVHMLSTHVPHTVEQIYLTEKETEPYDAELSFGVMVQRDDEPVARFMAPLSDHLPQRIHTPFFFLRMNRGRIIYGGATFTCSKDQPFTHEHLQLLRSLRTPMLMGLNNWFQYNELKELKEQIWQENLRLRQQLNGFSQVEVIGANGGLRQVMEKVRLAGPVDVPVLITGETGTGKEVIARAVHDLSAQHEKPFVAVNCGGIPPSLIDSELFGHVKGAFTGAFNDHKGRFERAKGGTIFLDEIGELPLDVQARLLRVLQERTIERVGGSIAVPVEFRLIAATNRDLGRMVENGSFREDLYYRLRVVSIRLPPLRERRQDIPLLVDHLLRRSALRLGVRQPELAPGEMSKLLEYRWPGNVRELQNVLEEALVLMPKGPLRFRPEDDSRRQSEENAPLPTLEENLAAYFSRLLKACGGRVSGPGGAAEKAGINANTLRSKLVKLGVPFGRQYGE